MSVRSIRLDNKLERVISTHIGLTKQNTSAAVLRSAMVNVV